MNIEDAFAQGFTEDINKFNKQLSEEEEKEIVSDNSIIKSEEPEKEEEEQEEVEETNAYEILAKELGYDTEQLDKYESSTEGLLAFIKDYTENTSKTVEQNVYDYIYEDHPVIADVLEKAYQSNRPTSEVIKEYYETLSFQPIEVEESDVESLRSVIFQQMESTGYFSKEEIEQKLDMLQDSGQLFERAKPIIDNYNQGQLAEQQRIVQQEKQKMELIQAKAKQQGEQLLGLIQNRKLANITIPEKDIQPFASFVNERLDRDNEGNLYIKTYFNSLTDLETEFIKYRGGVTNIKDLVGLKANSELAKKLFTSSNKKEEKGVDAGFNAIFGHLKNK